MLRVFPKELLASFGLIAFLSIAGAVATQAEQREDKTPSTPPASKGETGQQPPTLQVRPRYQLRLSDVLALSFPFTPEFDQTVTIQPDGYIFLRGAGSIRVVGHTIPEATLQLQNAYAKILHDPIISVELKEFEKPYFIVGGEVGHPGKFDLRGDTTVVEALEIAGGLKDSAKHSEVQFFKRVEGGWAQAKCVNVKKLLQEGNLEESAYLQPGDLIYVPKNTLSKIARFLPTTSVGAYVSPIYH